MCLFGCSTNNAIFSCPVKRHSASLMHRLLRATSLSPTRMFIRDGAFRPAGDPIRHTWPTRRELGYGMQIESPR